MVESYTRFDELSDKQKAIQGFCDAVARCEKDLGVAVSIPKKGSEMPILPPGVFSYDDQIGPFRRMLDRADENAQVVIVEKGKLLLGFGLAYKEPGNSYFEIDIVEVRERYRRSAGVEVNVSIENQDFGVGVSHLIVYTLIDLLRHDVVRTNAMPRSWYTFMSLGFKVLGDDSWLELKPRGD